MKILAVDDDPVILDLLPVVLRQEGHGDVTTASSGAAALEILGTADRLFDVLILDIDMPGMDGVTLCSRIRELSAYRKTPIIMLTARSDAISIERAFGAGANDYITKPFDVKDIGPRIQIAERKMQDTCKTCMLVVEDEPLPENIDVSGFGVEDPVRIIGLKQHTDAFSLGNYLSQLARTRVDETSAFAAQIVGFEGLHEGCTHDEILLVIADVSNAISYAAENKRFLNAYVGSGTFMCIASEDAHCDWPEMEERANEFLKTSASLRGAGFSPGISVIVGRPFRPNASKTKRVGPTFGRALSLLERRANMVTPAQTNI